jgi:hypothetical protein
MTQVVSIYYSNCYNVNRFLKNPPNGGSAVGALASMINHSCLPNLLFSYDGMHGRMLFYAIQNIPRWKELCKNYEKMLCRQWRTDR